MGPFAVLFNAGALIAALVAVHLQRVELAENRRVLEQQQKELEKAATAQNELAQSQLRLAKAQEHANVLTLGSTAAQYESTLASVAATLAEMGVARSSARVAGGATFEQWERKHRVQDLAASLEATHDQLTSALGETKGEMRRLREAGVKDG